MENLDPQQLVPLGIVGVVAAMLFRSWWRTDEGWKAMFDVARKDATDARADAAIARADAAAARADASAARSAETMCRTLIAALEARIHELEARNERHPEEGA